MGATTYIQKTLVGMTLFALVTGLAVNFLYDRIKPETGDTSQSKKTPKTEIDSYLDACYTVPPHVSRFIVLPAEPTGIPVSDFTLKFRGVLGGKIAVIQNAVLKEGVDKGALKIFRGKWVMALGNAKTSELITSFTSAGVNSFDVEKRLLDDVMVFFAPQASLPSPLNWNEAARTSALAGKCNLLNFVIL